MIDNTLPEDRLIVAALLQVLGPIRPVVERPGQPAERTADGRPTAADRGFNADLTIVTHYGAPVPWARARTRGGVFFKDKRTRAAAEDLGKVFLQITPRPVAFTNLALVCLFYMPTRQIVDADNLTKLVMDAATKAHVWEDDSQVTAQATLVEYCGGQMTAAQAQARTVVGLVPIVSTLDRTVPLERRRRPSLPLPYKAIRRTLRSAACLTVHTFP